MKLKQTFYILPLLAAGLHVSAQNTFPSSGNVGIGTTSPSKPLHIQRGGDNFLKIENTATNGSIVHFGPVSSNGKVETQLQFEQELGFYDHSQNAWRFTIKPNGNVGIGTSSPGEALTVSKDRSVIRLQNSAADGSSAYGWLEFYDINSRMGYVGFGSTNNNDLYLTNNSDGSILIPHGNVGIGAANPSSKLEIEGASPILTIDATDTGGDSEIFFDTRRDDTGTNYNTARIVADAANGYSTPTLSFYVIRGDGAGWDRTLTIKSNGSNNTGNVGIGTSDPSNKLEVNGTIRSKEVKVEATGWPDYVFDPDYDLKSLEEIEKFIQSNHHLPEIPSAKEMEAKGVQLGEMNRLLLKKIEELTLHTIQQQKEIERLKNDNKEIEKIKQQLAKLSKVNKER